MNMREVPILFFCLVMVAHCAQAALPIITSDVTIGNLAKVDLDGAAGAGKITVDCRSGFVIGSGVTVTWAVTAATVRVNGIITFISETSKLVLSKDLRLGAAGVISQDNFKQVFTGKFAVRDTYGNPLLMTIDDENYDRYKNGFTIPLGRSYEWNAFKPVNGPIVFTAFQTQLVLRQDLLLGNNGTLRAMDPLWQSIWIEGCGKKIVLGNNVELGGNYFFSNDTDLTIDGNGYALVLPESFDSFRRINNLKFKNMMLIQRGKSSTAPLFFVVPSLAFDNVLVKFSNTTKTILCGNRCSFLDIQGDVSFQAPGKRIKVKGGAVDFSLVVAQGATLSVGPEVVFELCDARDPGNFTLSMGDASATLALDGCTLYTGVSGLTLSTGAVNIDHKVNIYTKNYGQSDNPVGPLTLTGVTKTIQAGAAVSVNDVDGWGAL